MSAASKPLERPMTVAEFLAYDDGTDARYELVNGALVAMNPPATRHVQICQNIGRALDRQLKAPCQALWSSLGVALSEADSTWRQPDLIVNCAKPFNGYYVAPRLVVEVLSPSTEKDDRTTKLDFYESLPSVEAILLVW
jgi:Uma2 family endonuclease